jgi:hypothetical protein
MLDRSARYAAIRPGLAMLAPIIALAACTSVPERPLLPAARLVPASEAGVAALFEDAGTLIVETDSACGISAESGTQVAVQLDGSLLLPAYADRGTVFLNGWKLRYTHGDDANVSQMMVLLGNIRIESGTLKWTATGFIEEDDFDIPFELCYTYTALGWNSAAIDARSQEADTPSVFGFPGPGMTNWLAETGDPEDPEADTALVNLPSYLHIPRLAGRPIAVLPRGFNVWWREVGIFGADHNLIQLAYDLDRSETFVRDGKHYKHLPPPALPSAADRVDDGFVSWHTHAIMKDNDTRTSKLGFEMLASALGGGSVGLVQPPFTILPLNGHFGCAFVGSNEIHTVPVVVENVPFDYAIPMLTGWDVSYACNDENVREIGAWLSDISYEKPPAPATGTLRYTFNSVLRDNDDEPIHGSDHRVTILGLNTKGGADLIPADPTGGGFCALDAQGRLLVRVRNAGSDDAPASTTRVVFGAPGPPVSLPTPPLSGGALAMLPPVEIPPDCGDGDDCGFRIRVDAEDAIAETDETNNDASGSCPS